LLVTTFSTSVITIPATFIISIETLCSNAITIQAVVEKAKQLMIMFYWRIMYIERLKNS
jgi:hypothetical protein